MTDSIEQAIKRLITGTNHWSPARWRQGQPPHAESVAGLVQALADVVADAEGQPRRPVPEVEVPMTLVAQLAVMARDLRAVERELTEEQRGAVLEAIAATRADIF